MTQMIFVNLPVADLEASKAFYAAIGAENNPQFTDETAAMMSFSEAVNVMLLTHDKYRQFTSKAIVDAKRQSEASFALSRGSRKAVDAFVEAAAKAGAVIDPTQEQDFGWMYSRGFEDPDGHVWEAIWMDVEAAARATAEPAAA